MIRQGDEGYVHMTSTNKLLARRYFEQILNAGNFSIADTLLASDFVFRNPPIITRGVNEFKAAIESVRAAFSNVAAEPRWQSYDRPFNAGRRARADTWRTTRTGALPIH